jgi:4-aminobutyrate aminotransferase-like enzyme/Ser/Thr protein kinase RdoA (MazF antagonist)
MTTVDSAPRFSAGEAEEIARRVFGFTGLASPLPSERDQNFLLTVVSGERRILKIANPAEDPANLEMQNAVMLHLAAGGGPDAGPKVFADLEGRFIGEAKSHDGVPHAVRLVSYIEGTPLGSTNPQPPELLGDLGRFLGRLTNRLESFDHPSARRDFYWDLCGGGRIVREYRSSIEDPGRRELLDGLLDRVETILGPRLDHLPRSVVHNDVNDFNVIVSPPSRDTETFGTRRIGGLIDFGDMVHSITLAEPAVACAYVMLGKDDPLAAAAAIVAGYQAEHPPDERDLESLFPLIVLRLLMSVAICARQSSLRPDNEYLKISNAPAWALLEKLRAVSPRYAESVFRNACGLPAHPDSLRFAAWAKQRQAAGSFAPVMDFPLNDAPKAVFDLSIGTLLVGNPETVENTPGFTRILFDEMTGKGVDIGIGRYDEARIIDTAESFRPAGRPFAESRTVHLGIDVFAAAGSPVYAPYDGVVKFARDNAGRQDYGPTIILEHAAEGAGEDGGVIVFHTLYGHLSRNSLAGLVPGQAVKKGERIAWIGPFPENGDWPPHLHFQIMLDLLGENGNYPGVCKASERGVWLSLCPDANLILGMNEADVTDPALTPETILIRRREHLGPSLSISYRKPLKIVRGFKQHLYDHTGRLFLDAVNNVPHVGHSHPRVAEAVARQAAVLNTNTRYLHDILARYIERLTAKLPEPLKVCYLVNSGSEANDLALRLARNYTGRRDMIVLPGAYHGHLTSLIEISPYKFDGKGGPGRPVHTQVAEMPDLYRGIYRYGDPEAGRKYAESVGAAIERMRGEGRLPAGFIAESLLSCGGQIVLPEGYLREVYRRVKAAGGVCIADEVQVGFGRVGTHFWGFETQGVVPDIVTMGKPIGNGFPLAAVVTTREIADAFATGMEYFNTYGGNPVSCAAGMAVLDVLAEEKLQENALRVGVELKAGLQGLRDDHPVVGDVRGLGLFLGVELVMDRSERSPAADQAAYAANRMREEGILLSPDGPDHNVLKIKPPMCFNRKNAEMLVATLDQILREDPLNQ